jgi:hypothetical protein
MSGPKSGTWCVVSEGGLSVAEAQRVLAHYLDCILACRRQLEDLQRRHPELNIDLRPDTMDPSCAETAEAIAAELNNRYQIEGLAKLNFSISIAFAPPKQSRVKFGAL